MHRKKISVFIAVAVVFLVVQPVHGFQIWFLDVGQGDGVFLRTQDEAILSDCGSSQDKKIREKCAGTIFEKSGNPHAGLDSGQPCGCGSHERDRVAFEGGGRYPGAESGTSGGGKRAGGI